jgi:hypothetical protein
VAIVKITAFSVHLKPSKHFEISNRRRNKKYCLKILSLAAEIKINYLF